MLQDSGARREFETGAVRDIAEGKGRCDLLPLGILAEGLNLPILGLIDVYIRTGEANALWDAISLFTGSSKTQLLTAMLAVARHYEAGAKKYSERNWENGIPLHCFIDSGVRHYLKFERGDTDEPHNLAFIWNMLGAIWTHHNVPEMWDLPFVKAKEEECAHRR